MKSWLCIYSCLLFVVGCVNPDTPCDCHHTITDLNNSFVEREIELAKFDPDEKDTYANDILEFKQDLLEANAVLRHCKDVYSEQGVCKDYGESLWDMGEGYYLPDMDEFIENYTGDWQIDSTAAVQRNRQNDNLLYYLHRESYYDSLAVDSFPLLYRRDAVNNSGLPADPFPEWYRKEVEGMK